jgi:CHAD domain-containing protein
MKDFQLILESPLEEGIKKLIYDQISRARDQIENQTDIHLAVHESRRTLKRIRAVLRLVRDEIGYSNYYRENILMRDLGRRLSGARDHQVLLRTFSSLEEVYPASFSGSEISRIKQSVEEQIDLEINHFMYDLGGFEQFKDDLVDALGRVDQYCTIRNDFLAIENGLRRNYKQGRNLLKQIGREDHEIFHEFRKRSKYFLHHIQILRPLFPRLMKAYAKSIQKYSELLGETRDYYRLEMFLEEPGSQPIPADSRKKMTGKIRQVRNELLEKIFLDSSHIYAEKPGALVNRMRRYYHKETSING